MEHFNTIYKLLHHKILNKMLILISGIIIDVPETPFDCIDFYNLLTRHPVNTIIPLKLDTFTYGIILF